VETLIMIIIFKSGPRAVA